jgi:CheY-like chemotaxis protein
MFGISQSRSIGSMLQIHTAGKILVVDDEKFNCDIIEGFLMILGYALWKENTVFAYNGE